MGAVLKTIEKPIKLPSPFLQFHQWFEQALQGGVDQPHGMTFATVDANLQPSARIVLLKFFDEQGFIFFTNYQSRKAKDLLYSSLGALLFWWPPLDRQIRIEGSVEKISPALSDSYFHSRPYQSQAAAAASPQSAVMPNKETLLAHYQAVLEKYRAEGKVPRPDHWGGYRLVPHRFEFWQGAPHRLHDRVEFKLMENGEWMSQILGP